MKAVKFFGRTLVVIQPLYKSITPCKTPGVPSSHIPGHPGVFINIKKKIINLVTTSGPQGETCRINRTCKKQVQSCWLLGEEGHRLGWNEG